MVASSYMKRLSSAPMSWARADGGGAAAKRTAPSRIATAAFARPRIRSVVSRSLMASHPQKSAGTMSTNRIFMIVMPGKIMA